MSKIVFSFIYRCLLVILAHPLTPRQVAQGSEVCDKEQRPSFFLIFCFSEAQTRGLMLSFTSVPEICYQTQAKNLTFHCKYFLL